MQIVKIAGIFIGFCAFALNAYSNASPLDLAVKLEEILLDPDYDSNNNAIDKDYQSSEVVYQPLKIDIRSSEELFTNSEELLKRQLLNKFRTTTTTSTTKSPALGSTRDELANAGGLAVIFTSMLRSLGNLMGMSGSGVH